MHPKIVLVITDRESNAQIKPWKVDLLEIRVDLFKRWDLDHVRGQILSRKKLKIPLLLTVRNQKKEGAAVNWSNNRKRQILQMALPLVNIVDIELSSPLLKETLWYTNRLKKKVIVSIHDFNRTPSHLEDIFKKALKTGADMIKIAAKANSFNDVFRMVEFTYAYRQHRLITASMGSWGKISRLILAAAGSLYTYTFLHKPTALGQIDVKTLRAHLKFYYP